MGNSAAFSSGSTSSYFISASPLATEIKAAPATAMAVGFSIIYTGYNIVIYNRLGVPLHGSPNTLLSADTVKLFLPNDNPDTIDALLTA